MSNRPPLRPAILGLTIGALAVGGLAVAPAASASVNGLVINEVYGGGGNSGAAFTNDFIELRNTSSADITLDGWSVQYASTGGTSWQATALSGTIPAGGSYLVQEATNGSTGAAMPTPDKTGTINLSGSNGKVALVHGTTALGCGSTCAGTAAVTDFVGYGTANNYEGSAAAPGLGNATSDSRTDGVDTDDNRADFSAGAPTPKAGGTSGSGGGSTPPTCTDTTTAIGAVQGSGDASPVVGSTVTVAGTVVGDLQDGGFNGVAIQDGGDGDSGTSDGIFVFGSTLPALAQGDAVVVRGKVSEFNGLTELTGPAVATCGTAALPTPTPLPLPSTDAQREQLESMLVAPADGLTVTDVYNLDNFGEIDLAQGGRLLSPTEAADPGADSAAVAEANIARSILLDDGQTTDFSKGTRQAPPYLTADDPVRVGDTAHLQPQVLNYAFGEWVLEPADGTADGNTFEATNPRPAAPPQVGGDLRIADFNVLNYFVTFGGSARGASNQAEQLEQQSKIVAAITALHADVITLHEIENSAVTTPGDDYRAVQTLLAAIRQADGHSWDFVHAHEDTDVITNAIIYRTDRVTAVGGPRTPADLSAFDNARTPIAQTFHAGDETFTIIANHFKSKGSSCGAASDDPSVGGAGSCNGDRVAQAHALVDFADQVVAETGAPDVLLAGDFNSYRHEDPVTVITGSGFTDMAPVLAEGEYSYVFQGGSGSLDHSFASGSLRGKLTGMGIWDINAVESYAYEYDGYEPFYAPNQYRASDHNPTVLGLRTNLPATAAVSDPHPQRGDQVTVTGRNFTAGTTVQVTVPRPGHPEVITATVGSDGTVSVPFRVHPGLREGTYEVTLTAADGEQATASFTVAAPSESAPGH